MSTTTMTETTKSKLVEAIECGQFQAIPDLCESMAYELALKTDMLVDAIAKRSQAELQQILIDDGGRISCYQHEAAHTITRAMHLMFRADTEEIFERWLLTPPGAAMARDGIMLGNLQGDLERVLRRVEVLSRRFLDFLEASRSAMEPA